MDAEAQGAWEFMESSQRAHASDGNHVFENPRSSAIICAALHPNVRHLVEFSLCFCLTNLFLSISPIIDFGANVFDQAGSNQGWLVCRQVCVVCFL